MIDYRFKYTDGLTADSSLGKRLIEKYGASYEIYEYIWIWGDRKNRSGILVEAFCYTGGCDISAHDEDADRRDDDVPVPKF